MNNQGESHGRRFSVTSSRTGGELGNTEEVGLLRFARPSLAESVRDRDCCRWRGYREREKALQNVTKGQGHHRCLNIYNTTVW